jgi:nucleoside 2-deoxyribosyltransferase
MRVYLAGPLFTHAERAFLGELRDSIRDIPGLVPVWPGDLFDDLELADLGHGAKEHIYRGCLAELEACGLVAALLDGVQVDDGTAWEIGYAAARGVPVVGLRTDFRNAGDTAHSLVNCMIECSCREIVRDVPALLGVLRALAIAP